MSPGPTHLPKKAPTKPKETVYDRFVLDVEAMPLQAPGGLCLETPTRATLQELAGAYSPRQLTPRKHQILLGRLDDPDEESWLIRDADGALCGFCSISWTDHYEAASDYTVQVRAHQFLLMDDLVFAEHRRRGLHRFSILERCRRAVERGRRQGVVLVRRDNSASRDSYLGAGARYAGRLHGATGGRRARLVPELLARSQRRSDPASGRR